MSGYWTIVRLLAALLLVWACVDQVHALPAFASQTGQQCAACHVGGNWPELTPWGRFFKLSGYTVGQSAWSNEAGFNHVPAGAFAQAGVTWGRKPDDAAGQPVFIDNGRLNVSEATVYVAGKVTDFAGVFLEYTASNNYFGWSKGSDVMDLRAASFVQLGGHELLLGVDANAGPTMQDAWNTVPAWTFPYYSSPTAPGPPAAPIINGLANMVAGVSAYGWLDRKLYAEFGAYRSAQGFWRWMSWGQPWNQAGGVTYVDGYNPYWRLNYSDQTGPHAWMLGTFGLQVRAFPNNQQPSGATDRYTDLGVDAQYQHLGDTDKLTVRATYIYEKQHWDASYPLGNTSNPSNTLNQLALSATWWRNNTWGLSAAYLQTTGSADGVLYGVTTPGGQVLGGSPNTKGYVLEADYMVTQNIKLMAQYTGYLELYGRTSLIDGQGRKASDNNSLFLNLMVVY